MRGKTTMSTGRDGVTKKDLQTFKDEIIHEFRVIFKNLIDQMKTLVRGQLEIIERLDRIVKRINVENLKLPH